MPAPKSFSGTFGKPSRTWFQLLTLDHGSQIFFSSPTVRQFAQVFCRLTTTERPSFATVNATHLTPASRHLIASEFRIGREAFERSISLRQNRSKPPPVPEMPTVTRAFLFFFWKPSAAAIAYGPTVLEPSAVTVPLSAEPPAVAAAVSTTAARAASASAFFMSP